MDYGFLSVLPPLIAISLALVFRNVFLALFVSCTVGQIILDRSFFQGLGNSFKGYWKVFESNGNTNVIMVILLLGGLTLLLEKSGGIAGFVEYMTKKKNFISDRRGANIFTWIVGVVVFTSGTLSCLVTGAVSRPLSDSMKVSHEKLAFLIHTTSTPVCVLLPFSGWGAFMIGLMEAQGIQNGPVMLIQSLPLNFYCLLTVFLALFVSITQKNYGPMRLAEERAISTGRLDDPRHSGLTDEAGEARARLSNIHATNPLNLLLPILGLILMILIGLYITGNGDLSKGNGTASLIWGAAMGLFVAGVLYVGQKIMNFEEYLAYLFKGMGNLLPIASILVFGFAMGTIVKQLGTGAYLAHLFEDILSPGMLPMLVFVISCLISFSTGTSMGTMTVMFPLSMPLAVTIGVSPVLISAAIFGGSIFGDHSSPISDTALMSCGMSGCDVMDHVKTQFPYTLACAVITLMLYLAAGLLG
ncbi:MAG: hypothetical protein LBD82_06080 [Deltaproteobacteria bacterium]|jgi:Na+/H+ antiporter NhaC|nr:hypothetical protein [Deltaproteobacteria bacterium]